MQNNFIELSKGCQLCQEGKWLCIYLTYRCSACCPFCPAPFKDDRINSAFGNSKEQIVKYISENDFNGISFSGGDPFIVFDRLVNWVTYFKKSLPESYYYWIYTNGINVNKDKLILLASLGMDEIRFNIAATGYHSEHVWEQINIARDLFPFISIEIPSIYSHFPYLEQILEKIDAIGIDYLNLHDYILTFNDIENLPHINFQLNKISYLRYSLPSIQNTQNIIRLTLEKGYHFKINHCSMEQKEIQMTQRRLKMGKIFCDSEYDIFQDDGIIYNLYILPDNIYRDDVLRESENQKFREGIKSFQLKREELYKMEKYTNKILKIRYIPQMEIDQKKVFLDASII
jgi:uncharacterized protein